MSSPRFDVTSLGETMLRLSVPNGRRLETTTQLDLEYGGTESNCLTSLARIGRRVGWLSRVPDNPLGRGLLRQLRADGIDLDAVVLRPGERMGIYYVEFASAPRAIQVTYDRADSAASRLTVTDVDWGYVLDTRVLHLTGITPGLSASCLAVTREAIARARAAGVRVSFDVNFRGRVWTAEAAGAALRPLIAEVDLLMCKGSDATALFGCSGGPRELMSQLKALTRAEAVVSTFGADGAALLSGDGFAHRPALPVQIVDRIGSGDAFAAGVIDGWLDGDLPDGLRRGVGLAAIALSQHGDRVMTSRAELVAVLAQQGALVQR